VATIVVGIEDSLRGQDAAALAGDLARATGAELLAVCAYPYDDRPAAAYNPVMRAPMRDAAQTTLERLCEPLSGLPHVRRVPVADPSPARALLQAAEGADAALIVVGSSHAGFHGIVRPGSTGARLLSGAPCSVAIAPQGHRLRPHLIGGRVTVGFDGSANAHAALRAGAVLARGYGVPLRVVSVFAPDLDTPPWLNVPAGYVRLNDSAERTARAQLERAIATLPDAEGAFLIGNPADELTRESQVAELLVVGSRGYGPGPAVLVGDVSGHVVKRATCPVVIVPNGLEQPLGGLVGKLLSEATA
jgi:nucleotide-binding universal stress UspA family protein